MVPGPVYDSGVWNVVVRLVFATVCSRDGGESARNDAFQFSSATSVSGVLNSGQWIRGLGFHLAVVCCTLSLINLSPYFGANNWVL